MRLVGSILALLGLAAATACESVVEGGETLEGTEVAPFSTNGVVGTALQQAVLARAEGIAGWNRPYVFNGVQDCYGYVRQVWNAILHDGSPHAEDFYPKPYNSSRWLGVAGGLPVADAPSSSWVTFSSPSQLLPGDALSTAQGHQWGSNWHGGIYAGKTAAGHRQWDNTPSGSSGAYNRPLWSGFRYYYRPTHELLAKSAQLAPAPASTYQWLRSRHSGKCLEVASGENAAKVWQATCADLSAQRFRPEPTGAGAYRFVAELGGRCLDVPAGSGAQGTALQLWDCNGQSPQRFKLHAAGDGYLSLVPECSQQCVDVGGWSKDDQAQVIQWPCHGGANQAWQLSSHAKDVSCPPSGTSFGKPSSLGDLAQRPCSYSCWGSGSLYNLCAVGKWQFCLPEGRFAACQAMP